jgi:hypothetical protein
MTVVDGSLIEVLFWDAIVLPAVDEALENWKPASKVDQHIIEPQSVAERY